jgi:hypothetical protein
VRGSEGRALTGSPFAYLRNPEWGECVMGKETDARVIGAIALAAVVLSLLALVALLVTGR